MIQKMFGLIVMFLFTSFFFNVLPVYAVEDEPAILRSDILLFSDSIDATMACNLKYKNPAYYCEVMDPRFVYNDGDSAVLPYYSYKGSFWANVSQKDVIDWFRSSLVENGWENCGNVDTKLDNGLINYHSAFIKFDEDLGKSIDLEVVVYKDPEAGVYVNDNLLEPIPQTVYNLEWKDVGVGTDYCRLYSPGVKLPWGQNTYSKNPSIINKVFGSVISFIKELFF